MDAVANFATSLVVTAPATPTAGTSVTVTAGQGVLFPAVPFPLVLAPAGAAPTSTTAEIVTVTAVTTDTLTIVRARENTTAQAVAVGWQVYATTTGASLARLAMGQVRTVNAKFTTTPLQPCTVDDVNAYLTQLQSAPMTVLGSNGFQRLTAIEMIVPGLFMVVGFCQTNGYTTSVTLMAIDDAGKVQLGAEQTFSGPTFYDNGSVGIGLERLSDTSFLLSSSTQGFGVVTVSSPINIASTVTLPATMTQLTADTGYSNQNSTLDMRVSVADANTFVVGYTTQITGGNYVAAVKVGKIIGQTITFQTVGTMPAGNSPSAGTLTLAGMCMLTANLGVLVSASTYSYLGYVNTFQLSASGAVKFGTANVSTSYSFSSYSVVIKWANNQFAVIGANISPQRACAVMHQVSTSGVISILGTTYLAAGAGFYGTTQCMGRGYQRVPNDGILIAELQGKLRSARWNSGSGTWTLKGWENQRVNLVATQSGYQNYGGSMALVRPDLLLRVCADVAGSSTDYYTLVQLNSVIGITTTVATNNQPVLVQMTGIVSGFTGLIPGASYYMQDDTTLDVNVTYWKVGIAQSATTILLTHDTKNQLDGFNIRSYYAPYNVKSDADGVFRTDSAITANATVGYTPQNVTAYFVDATAGNITITLPRAATANNRRLRFFRKDATANTVTITADTNQPDLINSSVGLGAATYTLTTTNPKADFETDGSNFYVF